MKTLISRREFLKTTLAGAGLTIAASMTPFGSRLLSAQEVKKGLFNPNVWIQITPDNIVTIVVNKSEMGQGVSTSLPMIAADELEADWKQVRFLEAPGGNKYIDPNWGMQLTGGSTSVRHMFEPLRKASAAAREMLRTAAAQTWGVSVNECAASKNTVRHTKSGKSLTYGQLCEKASQLPVPENPPLKEESQFKLIGTSMLRLDVPDKVSGKAIFGIDSFVPDMLYATIARPPTIGAKIVSYDKVAAEKIPGIQKVASIDQGIAVCATALDLAWKGRDALKAKWDKGSNPELNNEMLEKTFLDHLKKEGTIALNRGSAENALTQAVKKIEATFVLPYLAHVTMEPMNCTAHVTENRCDIWVPTQNQSGALQVAQKLTGLKPEQIHIHTTYLGGGFGRRGFVDYVEEAIQISKATGKPIKLIWTREEDIQSDFYRPAYCCKVEGGIDAKGRITAWSHKIAVQSIFEHFAPQMIKNGIDPAAVDGIAEMEYEIPNLHIEYVKMDLPIRVGFWRSVGNTQNAFVKETFIDELAQAAQKDPLEFRLKHLKNPSARRVLQVAAEKAGWGKPSPKGQAQGIAHHFSFGTHVAQVAEISLNKREGSIKVHRVVCAISCGPMVNPNIIIAQMKGAIIMGLSAAMKEKIDFANGGVQTANFYDYNELRMNEAPEIEVHLVKSKDKIGGIGEPGLPPIAPAVANAVFKAAGIRLRNLPMIPETVLKAMKKV
ncbi:MAG: xanthine dehydrogenase family protein molybdopterin-binding subunit [Thermodesulfobacteriota bacterium]